MNIRILRSAMAALLFSLLAFPATVDAFPVARLRRVKPVVQVRGEAKTWVAARERNPLSYGNWVRTGSQGGADVLFNNGTRLALRKNTQIEIIEPPSSSRPLVVRVVGALSEVFVRARGRTEIRTAAGTAAVRGTEFSIRLAADDTTVLTVVEGGVDLSNPQGTVLVQANQQSTAVLGQAPTAPVAVDASGLVTWTSEISGVPIAWESQGFVTGAGPVEALRLRDAGDAAGALAAAGNAGNLGERLAVQMLLALDNDNAAQAQTLFEAAPAADQNAGPALAVRGLVALQRGATDEAVAFEDRALAIAPIIVGAHNVRALALTQRGQTKDAVAAARQAVQLAPNSGVSRSTLAWTYFFDGNTGVAWREARRAIDADPFSPFALLVYGRAALASGERDEAVRALGQAQALAPDSGLIQREAGEAWLTLENAPRAEAAFRVAAADDNAAGVRSAALSGLGDALAAQGKNQEAESSYKSAMAFGGPGERGARGRYGAFLIQQGRLKEAQGLLQLRSGDGLSTAQDEIGDVPLLVRLAELSLLRQDLYAAQGYAQRAVKLAPRSAPARYQLGRVYLEQERTTFAEEQFRQAIALDPDLAAARFALGISREQIESGKDPSRAVGNTSAASSTGPNAALNLQNLLTPGAPDRIQAAVQDPTVFVPATRAFGSTQIDGVYGTNESKTFALSHLRESDDRRGAMGITINRDDTDGFRQNTDFFRERLGGLAGIKDRNNPSGIFGLAQVESSYGGQNDRDVENVFTLSQRFRKRVPIAVIGANLQRRQDSRTRVLVGFDEPRLLVNDILGDTDSRGRSIHGELRHDRRVGNGIRLSAGVSLGRRTVFNRSTGLDFDPQFFLTGRGETVLDSTTGYVRAEKDMSSRLNVVGELRLQRLEQTVNTSSASTDPLNPVPFPNSTTRDETTAVLPTVIATYRVSDRDTLRFRARNYLGTIQDFQLLAPVDVWSFAENDGLFVNLFGRGRLLELQGDHTFKNASFLRYGVFHQRAGRIVTSGLGAGVDRGTVSGLRLRYEGILNRSTTYFLRGDLTRAKGTVSNQFFGTINGTVSQVPESVLEGGFFYLSRSGWFAQPSVAMIGSRENNILASRTLDSATLYNLRVGKRFGLRAVTFVEILNIRDEDYTLNSYQRPGRQVRVGASARF